MMKLKASAVKKLESSYSIFTFLSFVQDSKQGVLGLWSFILLLIAAAAAVFHLWGLGLFILRGRMAANPIMAISAIGKNRFNVCIRCRFWRRHANSVMPYPNGITANAPRE